MPAQTVRDFVAAINLHDIEKIGALMNDEHQFIDAHNNSISGRDQMKAAWGGYFDWFPDYQIELTDLFTDKDCVAAFGFALGTGKGVETAANEHYWRLPAAWKAIVQDGKITTWQVFADTKIPFDIMAKHGLSVTAEGQQKRGRATGIGGVFFKCKDPENLKAWYNQHLGLDTDQYGTTFEWRQAVDSNNKKGFTQWSPFSETTKYFAPSVKEFMINYRVEHLESLVEELRKAGVTIVDKIEAVEYGAFVHIMDPEENKIELWEPIDEEYDKIVGGRTK